LIAVAFLAWSAIPMHPGRSIARHRPIARGHDLLGLPQALRSVASATIGSGETAYRLRASDGSFLAQNAAQRLRMRFGRSRVQIASGDTRIGLSLMALGYGSSLRLVGAGAPTTQANRATYAYRELSEWFVNGPLGLEQGFTIPRAPRRETAGLLTLSIAISGNAHASLDSRGESLTLVHLDRPSMRYGSLVATDAGGRPLRTWLQLRGAREILLRVDTRGARYPLRIDPLLEQREKLTAGNEIDDLFGESVALSADGNTALIGEPNENGDVGAAYVFTRSGTTWVQQGKLTADDEKGTSFFGDSVALSADGDTALIGGPGTEGRGPDFEGKAAGAAWVFTRSGSTWSQQGPRLLYERDYGENPGPGWRVALSADGNTALIGSSPSGVAWVFARSGSTWTQQAELSGTDPVGEPAFGRAIALSADGDTALIGGPTDDRGTGAVWAFTRTGSTWTQQGEKFTGSEQDRDESIYWGSEFGDSIAVSADGNTAIIGGARDHDFTGAIWSFTRSGSTWTQSGSKITARGETGEGFFGGSAVLTPDGNTALVGGFGDNSDVGAVWTFTRSGSTFVQEGEKLTASDEQSTANFGYSMAISSDADTALIGGFNNDEGRGAAWVFETPPAVTTGTASAIGQTSATLNAEVYPAGQAVSDCRFEYGPSASYGFSAPCSSLPEAENHPVSVSARVVGLDPGTAYHFRIVATIAGVTSSGSDEVLTTPSPSLPEVGRCLKLARATGRYQTSNCTTLSAGEDTGKYYWQPWPASEDRFYASGGATTFETVGKAVMKCSESRYTGEYSSSQAVTASATFVGCEVAGVFGGKCQSENAQPGEVATSPLEGRLAMIKGGATPSVGWELQPTSGPVLASFACGESRVSMTGSVIASVTAIDKMTATLSLRYTASKGKQAPEAFEGGAKNTLSFVSKSAEEQVGLTATSTLTNEESIEIKAIA
jgi:hypothetical protein